MIKSSEDSVSTPTKDNTPSSLGQSVNKKIKLKKNKEKANKKLMKIRGVMSTILDVMEDSDVSQS